MSPGVSGTPTVVTTDDIRSILLRANTLPEGQELDDDTELSIDSFSLAWLTHSLSDEFGIELDMRTLSADEFGTLRQMQVVINDLARSGGER